LEGYVCALHDSCVDASFGACVASFVLTITGRASLQNL
jgi:hypothetical protein